MITVVDYGMGNLRNVRRAFESLGEEVLVTASGDAVAGATTLVLPGVGAFGEAVRRIDALQLREPLMQYVDQGRPLLGICLGMQLLFEASEESEGATGLGILKGTVMRFREGLHVPHIGWNDVLPKKASPLFPQNGGVFYFVHSFYAPECDATIATTEYGVRYSAAVQAGNVFGVQFHPEKSERVGLEMLRRFCEIENPK
jgi:imidazole glycerol phosphate synthase glutamine amidotransferase subunit